MKKISFISLISCLSIACNAQSEHDSKVTNAKYVYQEKNTKEAQTVADKFYAANQALTLKVDSVYQSMSAEQRAAQMIMVASSETLGFPYATTVKTAVSKDKAANVLFLKGTKAAFIKQSKELNTYKIEGLKPLYACDCEPTLLHYKFIGQKKMTPAANLKSTSDVNKSVDTLNKLMDEMGITINFAPLADIAANKSVINKRSFGTEPALIEERAGAFIKRTQADNKAAAIKHFPGHGAVTGDSHKQSVFISGKMTELNTFEDIIKNDHPLFVMVGHIEVKNNAEGFNTENGRPATTSRKIITDLLRNKIGFKGIIVTDAMNMQASKNFPDADWEAAKAGADLVLMPLDASKLNAKIAAEIKSNTSLGKQFEASAKRIIKLKLLSEIK